MPRHPHPPRTGPSRALPAALAVALVLALAGGLGDPAAAQDEDGPVRGYDGHNPFDCTLQQVGRGTDFPEPEADPFCVEYDKTGQNVDQLGMLRFLSAEPVRVAAAVSPCFYFQHDHWRSQLVQGVPATETYAWDGSYFIDKARGIGGVHVENFTLNGRTVDPTTVPGFPAEYEPHFGPGRGGFLISSGVPVDPRCAARARQGGVYAH